MAKVEIELPELEGYEYTGEYRTLQSGDYFLTEDNNVGFIRFPQRWAFNVAGTKHYHILRKKRWTPEYNEVYWFVGAELRVLHTLFSQGSIFEETLLKEGNYFKTKEQAEAAAEKIRKVLKEIKDSE